MEQHQQQKSRTKDGRAETRMTEAELAIRRTTLPLHSFLTADELSLYYILDRFPVRSPNGIGDPKFAGALSSIMGRSLKDTRAAIESLATLGMIQAPGTDTLGMESVIDFPIVCGFCKSLGDYPIGFGRYLRKITGDTRVDAITPLEYTKAYQKMTNVKHHI
jgi:hypothetical protein